MSSGPKGFDREKLFTEVWSQPMTKLAPQYGLSDQGLRKICVGLQVPLPGNGHWAKIAAGQQIATPPLLPLGAPSASQRTSQITLSRAAPTDLALYLKPVRWPASLHPALRPLCEKLNSYLSDALLAKQREEQPPKRGRPLPDPVLLRGTWGSIVGNGYRLRITFKRFALRTSIFQYQRALGLMSAVCYRASGAGFRVSLEENCERVKLTLTGQSVEMRVSEKFEAGRGSAAKTPTGMLRIHLEDFQAPPPSLSDTKSEKLETKLDLVLQAILRHHQLLSERSAAREEQRRRAAISAREREAREAHLAAKRAIREAEMRKRAELVAEAQDWERAQSVLRYVTHLDKEIARLELDEPPRGYQEWRQWALEAAAIIDKSTSRIHPPDEADQSMEASRARLAAAGIFIKPVIDL